MANRLTFENRPLSDVPGLQAAIQRLVQQFGDGATAVLLPGVDVDSVGTPIRHGLRATPRAVLVNPWAEIVGPIYEYADPDAKNLYLKTPKDLVEATFTGRNGAGSITVGTEALLVGDTVEHVLSMVAGASGSGAGFFESTVTVAAQLQQSSGLNLSGVAYWLRVRRARTVTCDLLVVA